MASGSDEVVMASASDEIDASEINGYIHSVTPMKKVGQTSYFNYSLQTESSIHKGVGFNKSKQATLEQYAKEKSPVKIKDFTVSTKYGHRDILINKATKILPSKLSFAYESQEKIISITDIARIAPDQLISIKGHLAHLGAEKKMVFGDKEVAKREGYINDHSGFIKIIFWGNYVNVVNQDSTYQFQNLRVRESQGEKYLNTPKQENCSIVECEPFQEPLCPLDDVVNTSSDITATIVGLSNINRYTSCISCHKKVTLKGKIAVCTQCKMMQRPSSCPIQWSMKLHVLDNGNPTKKVALNLYGKQIDKLFSFASLTLDSTEEELSEAVLQLDIITFTYDLHTNKILDMLQLNM